MPSSIRELILDGIVSELEAISAGAGDEQTVLKVYRPQRAPQDATQYPCVIIRDLGDEVRRHVRLAWESRMRLDLLLCVRKTDPNERTEAVEDFVADVIQAVTADETHGQLSVKTNVIGLSPSYSESNEPNAAGIVSLEVLYRIARDNPFVVREI